MMQFEFDPDFQKKILCIRLTTATTLHSPSQWAPLKQQWCEALNMWHTPYKALLDFSLLTIPSTQPDLVAPLFRIIKFFSGFYLKKAAIFGLVYSGDLPVTSVATREEALQELGVRMDPRRKIADDFRSLIEIDNHLPAQIVEVSFAEPVHLATKAHIATLRSKLTHNLMHWHQSWCLLVDMSTIASIDPAIYPPVNQMLEFFSGFFMLGALGYGSGDSAHHHQLDMVFCRTKHKAMMMAERLREQQSIPTEASACPSKPS